MLADILELAGRGGALSITDIAEDLGVSPNMAEAMCLELACQGYLAALNLDCAAGCAACGKTNACHAMRTPRLWTLTSKGARALERRRACGRATAR